jgi:hypothetical protein
MYYHLSLSIQKNATLYSFVLKMLFVCLLIGLQGLSPIYATHIVSGEISATRTGTLTYCFTIILYSDPTSGADSPDIRINFGDGTTTDVLRIPGDPVSVGPRLLINRYNICHTFPQVGCYRVSVIEENRIANIRNMDNSINTPFAIDSQVCFIAEFGQNQTPVLRVPPLDIACPNQKFFHNPGAFDPDGDSLVFRLVVPKLDRDRNVDDYTNPQIPRQDNGVEPGGQEDDPNAPAGFTLNSRTGDIEWNSPKTPGIYNIAIRVEEYRNGILIGYIVRDMQIRVLEQCNNLRPRINVPDICAIADEDPATTDNIINVAITATDPNTAPLDEILIISQDQQGVTQGVYDANFFKVVASFTFSTSPKQFGSASGQFRWDTRCEHVRREPYFVVFRAQDQPLVPRGPKLIDLKTMQIQVKGPQPKNLDGVLDGRAVNLSWDNYRLQCPDFTDAQFNQMKVVIWRREGCAVNIACNQNPEDLGYRAIGEVAANATTFRDNGPLAFGLSYSYVITVKFPEPRGGVSQASLEKCITLPLDVPLITQVTIENTNTTLTDGSVQVRWLRPRPTGGNISAVFPPPYRYELYQAVGLNGTAYTLVDTKNDATGTLGTSQATAFVSNINNLNTKDNAFLYKVRWFYNVGTVNEAEGISSDSASTVRLNATGADNSVVLTWDYRVPWSNQNQYHYIYRAEGTAQPPKNQLMLIDSVFVGQKSYTDTGKMACLEIGKTYHYYIKTKGSYNNTQIPEPVVKLRNDSQIAAAVPTDNTPPPKPTLSIAPLDCSIFDTPNPNGQIANVLKWTKVKQGSDCQNLVSTYRLYYRALGQSNFVPIQTVDNSFIIPFTDTTFRHDDLPLIEGFKSQAGCYYVTAVDRNNNESAPSDTVCQDNCIYYKLPNVITPSATANLNDVFRPLPEPRYVQGVEFSVYNRWGNKVFENNNADLNLNWNGTDDKGKALPDGSYYYEVKVSFISIDPKNSTQKFTGWLHVIQ